MRENGDGESAESRNGRDGSSDTTANNAAGAFEDSFGLRTSPGAAAARRARPPRRGPDSVPLLPFAFRDLPPDFHFQPAQTTAVEEVQDQFIAALGGETADPATPEYREKWLDSQRLADLQLRARIGGQALAAWQRQRSMKGTAAGETGNATAP